MSENIEQLEQFIGYVGYVGSDRFKKLTSLLEKFPVIKEDEPVGTRTNYVETTYDIDGKHYMLWYQTRTPKTPEGMEFNFGFGRVES